MKKFLPANDLSSSSSYVLLNDDQFMSPDSVKGRITERNCTGVLCESCSSIIQVYDVLMCIYVIILSMCVGDARNSINRPDTIVLNSFKIVTYA